MNKDCGHITVMCDRPNNGYYAMVFTDSGTLMRSQCSTGDIYEGLVHSVSDVLMHCVEQMRPQPKVTEITEEAKADIDKYVDAMHTAFTSFMKAVQKQMCIDCTARQLKAEGLDSVFADMLAEGIHTFPGKFTPADNKEEDDNADVDTD